MSLQNCIVALPDGILLHLKATCRSSAFAMVGVVNNRVKIKIKAAPVDGKANKEIIQWLAKKCGVPQSSVEIIRGHTSREKTVRMTGESGPLIAALSASIGRV